MAEMKGLICLKFCTLCFLILAIFIMCFSKVRLESNMTPRFLSWDTKLSFILEALLNVGILPDGIRILYRETYKLKLLA